MDFFPHDKPRVEQARMMADVKATLEKKGSLIAHAPTGLGKTAAVLSSVLPFAEDKTIFFLTSRHTQHAIVLDTLKKISEKTGMEIPVVAIVGRQKMCPVSGISQLNSREFSDYCKTMREDDRCDFYKKTKNPKGGLSFEAKAFLPEVTRFKQGYEILDMCKSEGLCPYELSLAAARKAKVIVCDYYYLFNPGIREGLLSRLGKELEDIILVVDEAHNLPSRIRELMSNRLSSFLLKRGIREAERFGYSDLSRMLLSFSSVFEGLVKDGESLISKEDFKKSVERVLPYDKLMSLCDDAGEEIHEKKEQSSLSSIGDFLNIWKGSDDGFSRIISRNGAAVNLNYRCLDPSVYSSEVFSSVYSTIFMSGTLTPTSMYRDIVGFSSNTQEVEYASPFSNQNRLVIASPEVTSKYSARNDNEFAKISAICNEITSNVPGNSVIFFPSYSFKDRVSPIFSTSTKKTVLEERKGLLHDDREAMLENFRKYKDSGAVLLAVASGSFGEGIDLPGDLLKCVIVVGLPLSPPDLEVKELIRYFDAKFARGWDYGYTFPAITTSLQNAGRCIRTESDRGVIAFLEKRFLTPHYFRCFPPEWDVEATRSYGQKVSDFFKG